MIRLLGTVLFLLLMVSAVTVPAGVVNFDNIGTAATVSVPADYQGFNWRAIEAFEQATSGSSITAIKDSQIIAWYSISFAYPSPSYGIALRNELNINVLRITPSSPQNFDFVRGYFRGLRFSNCYATYVDIWAFKEDGSIYKKINVPIASNSWTEVTDPNFKNLVKLEISGKAPAGSCNSMWAADNIELVDSFVPDLADAVIALQVLAGITPVSTVDMTDISGDSKVGMAEVVYILRKVAGL